MGNIQSSGDKTATGVVTAKPCRYWGMTGYATSDDVEITLHDNYEAASGTVVDRMKIDFSVKPTDHHTIPRGVFCAQGLYMTISGTSPKAVIQFEPL